MDSKRHAGLAGVFAVLVVTSGCGGGSGVTQPSGGPTPAPTPAPRATIRGQVMVEGPAGASPVGGATVAVANVNPSVTTTSAADGSFSLETPIGVVELRVTAGGYWGGLAAVDVPASGLAGLEVPLQSDASIGATGGLLGRNLSSANGIVAVVFENESGAGGEAASISAASDPAFTISSSGAYTQGNALLEDSPPVVTFTNVPPGTTGVGVSGAPGRNTCSIVPAGISAWRVEAKVITYVRAVCRV